MKKSNADIYEKIGPTHKFPSRRKDATWEKIFWKGMEGTWAQE